MNKAWVINQIGLIFSWNKVKLIWDDSFHQNMDKDRISSCFNSKKCLYMGFSTLQIINKISATSG